MKASLILGNDNWAVKDSSLLGYTITDEDNFEPEAFNVTRASTKTRINRDGLIESVANNVASIDFLDDTEGVLLTEPQSTNLITYSEDFSNVSWSKFQSSIINSQYNNLTNLNNATLHYPTINSSYSSLFDTIDLFSGIYTRSVFAKSSGKNYIVLDCLGGNTDYMSWFDLENGVIGTTGSSVTSKIEDYGNGWYKCSVTNKISISANYTIIVIITDNDNSLSVTKNGTDGILLWGAQTEALPYATSYIPTNGSTVTRVKDVVNNAGDVNTFNSEEGVLFVEMALGKSKNSRMVLKDISNINNRIAIIYVANQTAILFEYFANGIKTYNTTVTVDVSNYNKYAFKWKLNDFSVYLNSILQDSQFSGNVAAANSFDNLDFSDRNGNNHFLIGKTKQLKVFKTALSDAELTALTS